MCDWAGSANACFGIFPCGLHVVAKRCDSTHAGDYYSFKFHCVMVGC